MKRAYLQSRVLTVACLAIVLALTYFAGAAPPPAYSAAPVQTGADSEALVFTPALTGVSDIVKTRGPAAALAAHLSETSGISVTTFVPTDYGAVMLGLGRGRYDLAYLPGPFLVKAEAELGATPALAVSANGALTETGMIVVAADSGISALADLAGKSVGAADLESGTGWVMPAAALKEAGLNALTDLDVYFTGTDAENVLAVLNGDLDAAFISASALADPTVTEAESDTADKLTVLAEFPDVPVGGLVFAKDVAEADRNALIEALSAPELAEAVDAEGNPLLAGLGWDGLAPVSQADFGPLHDAAMAIGMIKAAMPVSAAASQPMTAMAAMTETEGLAAGDEVTATEKVTAAEEVTATEEITAAETAAGSTPSATPTPVSEEEPLVFTPALTGVSNIMQVRGPAVALADYIAESSGVPITVFVPTDYGATMQGLERGRYDIAYLPGPFLVKAQAELGAIPAFSVSANGAVTETGLIVVAADSGIEELADLEGKSVGVADLESGAGWVMPAAALKAEGINALIDLDVYFTGTDPENVLAVLDGELDAAFISAAALVDPAVLEADAEAAEKLTILAEFPDVPVGGIVFGANMDETVRAVLSEALGAPELAEAVDAGGNLLLAGLGWDELVLVDEVDYSALTEAATATGMIKRGE